ncbi:MAG: protein kinase [Bradymonadaceae bacterium]|nr:protein kinase [Lujinxingiaceae bacterium]
MGEVWHGVHGQQKLAVAIKVVIGKLAAETRYLEGFHREVQAIAGLDHPGIVRVYDYGVVNAAAAAAEAGLGEGSPWLAMELATLGSLENMAPIRSWFQLRRLLLEILDALAHAHAHGIVHRDLKPPNVLRTSDERGQVRLMLSDFGIAHIADPRFSSQTADVPAISAGTPLYMAPEQIHGQWRDYGPWTDLYALGCMAFEFAGGEAPFVGGSLLAIAMQHISAEVPRLSPRFAVPEGFEGWLKILLAKDHGQRYQCAADAAWALESLDQSGLVQDEAHDSAQQAHYAPANAYANTLGMDAPGEPVFVPTLSSFGEATQLISQDLLAGVVRDDTLRRGEGSLSVGEKPPLPLRWRGPGDGRASFPLLGAGQGLFGLREIPFVDRQGERDTIWKALSEVHQSRSARVVMVDGPAGFGKTRLLHWMAQRANELGGATIMKATNSPIMGVADGIPRMIQTHLTGLGLTREKLYERTRQHIELLRCEGSTAERLAMDAAGVVELIKPVYYEETPSARVPMVVHYGPAERYAAFERYLFYLCKQRPVIICIDDAQWSQDCLGFVEHLLEAQATQPLPVLVLVSYRLDALDERALETALLWKLRAREDVIQMSLDALPPADHGDLVRQMLGLEDDLVSLLTTHTAGNPLFAVQLVGDWIERNVLMSSPEGYHLRETGQGVFPRNIQALCTARIHRMLEQLEEPAVAQMALEVAAAIGQDVDTAEWQSVCDHMGVNIAADLVDALIFSGLGQRRSTGWSFALGAHRDSLEASARAAGRWADIHRACAAVIHEASNNGSCRYERRARHFLAANAYSAALEPLWQAIQGRLLTSSYQEAIVLANLYDKSVGLATLSGDSSLHLRSHCARADALRYLGNHGGASAEIEAVLRTQNVTDIVLADAFRIKAGLLGLAGDSDESLAHYQRALELFEKCNDAQGVARALHGLSWIYLNSGDLVEAERCVIRGRQVANASGHILEEAWCLLAASQVQLVDQLARAEESAHAAHALFTKVGSRAGLAVTTRLLGDAARCRNDIAQARRCYAEALLVAQSIGHSIEASASILLAMCDLLEGKFDAVQMRIERDIDSFKVRVFPTFHAAPHLALLIVFGHKGELGLWDEHFDAVSDTLVFSALIAREFGELLESAGKQMLDQGDSARASRCFLLAASLFDTCDAPHAADLRARESLLEVL